LPQLEITLRRFPKLVILGHGPAFWAEISTLDTPADRVSYPRYPVRAEGVVPKLLRRYPNLLGDLSAGSGHNALARDPAYAVTFLNEFQDKLLFGTDICVEGQRSPMAVFLQKMKAEGKISDAVFEKIARGNAIKLLGLTCEGAKAPAGRTPDAAGRPSARSKQGGGAPARRRGAAKARATRP
jgi:predicted TIM-barrel fold metal-dependent hydrolase